MNQLSLKGQVALTSKNHTSAIKAQTEPAEQEELVLGHDEIALRAYDLWIARGCPEGSPEEDWFCAEKALREQGH